MDEYENIEGNSAWSTLKTIGDILEIHIPSAVTRYEARFIYDTVRRWGPKNIIETGSGKSSLAILSACRDNNQGNLHSIDLPNLEGSRALEANSGVINRLWQDIKKEYPDWDIRERDIKIELPMLLSEMEDIDLFFHDSRHTEEQVFFEYNSLINSHKGSKDLIWGMHDRKYRKYKSFIRMLNSNYESLGFYRAVEFWRIGLL